MARLYFCLSERSGDWGLKDVDAKWMVDDWECRLLYLFFCTDGMGIIDSLNTCGSSYWQYGGLSGCRSDVASMGQWSVPPVVHCEPH